jgi:predicted transcriptional regulator of viral defense system
LTRRDTENAIAALASRQHGVVTRAQLIETGIAPDLVDRRLQAGQLRTLHRGVYFVGPLLAPRARVMAATLACGASAVVSHRSAAALWQLLPDANSTGPVEVIIPQKLRRHRPGIRIHRVGTLRSDDVTRHDEIRVTTPARTLFDLAAIAPQREVERALAEALALRLTDSRGIDALLTHHERHPGTGRLRAYCNAKHSQHVPVRRPRSHSSH